MILFTSLQNFSMERGICLSMILFLVSVASSQRCPSYWYSYPQSDKCFRLMYLNKLSWQDSRDICKIHGGDILRLDSAVEKAWIYSKIAEVKNHSRLHSDNWWIGLNNQEDPGTWAWPNGIKLTNDSKLLWAPGAPHSDDGNARCVVINNKKINDLSCSSLNYFICYRYRFIPLACDSDHGWQSLNEKCYKVYTAKNNWYNAKSRCEHDGGTLVTIDSPEEETAMHDFAISTKQPLWIGLQSTPGSGNVVQWAWIDDTPRIYNYWNGNPHVDGSKRNSTCVAISNEISGDSAWTAEACSQSKAFVCRKPEGVCFPGWIGHMTCCYQFNAQYRLSFPDAFKYCEEQNAELLRYTSGSIILFINSYLQEMKDSGVQDFWIGASDNNITSGPYKWRNGQSVTYTNWAAPHNTPTNTPNKQDCVYVSTSDRYGKWRTTSDCGAQKSFVCDIKMDTTVLAVPSTPRPFFGCPAGWHETEGECYKIFDEAVDWITARSKCQEYPGADLASIRTQGAQDFVNHLSDTSSMQYWIGLNDRKIDNMYVWNDETQPSTFTAWMPGQPNNYAHKQNCVVLTKSLWNDIDCSVLKHYICSKDANNILPPVPSTTPALDWTVKCGPGWESNPVTDFCYIFIDEPLSWYDALNQCQQFHGNLVAIETLEEQNYLAGRIRTMTSLGLWIGANDRGTEGGWRWSSGKPFAFLNWAAGQPAAHGNGTDCAVMFTKNAEWDDIDCSQRNGYICEKIGNVRTTQPPPTTTKKIPAGMTLGCKPGWKPYANNCYYFVRRKTNFMNAQSSCLRYGGHLASIQSKNEQDFIVGNLWKNPKRTDGVFIGLSDKQIESRFQWSDGSVVQYTNWGVNEPNSWLGHNEDCVEIKVHDGHWNDQMCTAQKNGFICKAPKAIVSATQNPFQTGCLKYSLGYGPWCYRLVSGAAKTWVDANSYCNRTYHGTLATVNDRYIQSFLSSQLLYKTGHFWLGLSDSAMPGTYAWANGDPVMFTYWHNSHTGNERSTCIGMRADQPIGLWENLDCKQRRNYICQYNRTSGFSTVPTTPTPYPNAKCPLGWTAHQGYCYYAFTQKSQRLTWMNARTYCQNLGGDLPSFHTSLNDSFLIDLPQVKEHQAYWIGLNDRDTEAGYVWSDGSAVDYTNWKPEEPNNFQGNEDCVFYSTSSKQWNDMSCYATENYVCAIPRGVTLPPATVIPTPARSVLCGSDPNWYFFNDNCYLLNPKSGPNATLSWYEANDYCQGRNAQLASIHTNDESHFIYGITNVLSLTMYWIGLNELGLNGFTWTDQTPLDYTIWGQGEPNNFFGAERCVEMRSFLVGRWNDENCGRKRGYVCKKPVSGHVVIPSPTPFPAGGCANGYTRVPGGRNKCFYINNNKLNWTAAGDQCRRFGVGYDIASIEDVFEQDFFMAMATGKHDNVWIGLEDRKTNNEFLWQDNALVIYTHWDRGEPTSRHSQSDRKGVENCVAVRMWKGHEGKWADVDCKQNFASLCQARQDPNLPTFVPPSTCSNGYNSYQQNCYKLVTDGKAWLDARAACASDGGSLVSINNIYESGYVVTLAGRNAPFWIGLSDIRHHGLYGWADGWPVRFTNWGQREPSYDNPTTAGCVAVNRNGRWNDTDCGRKLNYVCKITQAQPPPTTPVPPGNCSDSSWIPNGDYCYKAFVNQARSWPEANFQCRKSGMQLVSVHSLAEMDFVHDLVVQAKVSNPQNQPNIWLGLSKGPQGSFQWSDNSAVSFLYWNPGEPSGLGSHGQLEECVEFDRTLEKWNDISCFTNRGYVCKALKVFNTTLGVGGQPTNPVNPGFQTQPVFTWPSIIPTWPAVIPGQSSSSRPVSLRGVTTRRSSGQQQQQQQTQNKETSPGLSSGSIAGVVISVVIVIILVAIIILLLIRRGAAKGPKFQRQSSAGLGFDNALYDKNGDVSISTNIEGKFT